MEKEGPFVWLNYEWLPAHHYQRKSIPEKNNNNNKKEKTGKPKTSGPFFLWEIVLLVPNN